MYLQSLIKKKLATRDINEVARQLGYKTPEKVSARIKDMTDSPCLALDKSNFDFRYSSPELIRKLCAILDIPEDLYNKIIAEIEAYLLQQQQKFKPYIYVETNFQRKSEPIFALAAMESTRYISINPSIQNLPLNQLITHVQALVKIHYQKQTSLPMWGDIRQYAFFYNENTVIVLSAKGDVIDAASDYSRSRATLKLR